MNPFSPRLFVIPESHFREHKGECREEKKASVSSTMPCAQRESRGPAAPSATTTSRGIDQDMNLALTFAQPATVASTGQSLSLSPHSAGIASIYDLILPTSVGFFKKANTDTMPLVQHLKNGYLAGKPEAWHRSEERIARNLFPIIYRDFPLEEWERKLAWMEVLLLSGTSPECFTYWAHAWGQDHDSRMILAQFVGESASAQSVRATMTTASADSQPMGFSWAQEKDLLDEDVLDFSGALKFENLEQDMESLTNNSTSDGDISQRY